MVVTVKIPTQLRSVTGGESEAQVDDVTTVGEVLDGLYDRFDGLRDRIAEDGDLRRFVNVYVGGEDIRFLDGLETAVEDGDEVTILPAVAGAPHGLFGDHTETRRSVSLWSPRRMSSLTVVLSDSFRLRAMRLAISCRSPRRSIVVRIARF